MEQSKGKIGIREFVAIVILSIGIKLGDDTPAILFQNVQNAAWMVPIIIGIISILPIYFLIKVMTSYQEKNLGDVINHLFGRVIGFVTLFLLWLVGFTALTVDSAIYTDIIGTMYFTRTPTLIIYATLMGVCAYGSKKGIEHIGSVAWSVITWIKISLIVALIVTISEGQSAFLFPIFGSGKWDIIKESSMKVSLFGEILYLGLIFPYLRNKQDFKKGTWIALAIIIIDLTVALAAYIMLFDYNGVKMLNYPFHESIRYISVGFLANIETFFLPFWLIATFVRFTFYLYLNALLFGTLFKIKQFEYLIPLIASLAVLLGMIPEAPTFTIFYLRGLLLNITTPVFIFLPFLLWITAKFKGDLNNGKAEINK